MPTLADRKAQALRELELLDSKPELIGKALKEGWGIWRMERYPVGGEFARIPSEGITIKTVERTWSPCDRGSHGTFASVTLSNGWMAAICYDCVIQ